MPSTIQKYYRNDNVSTAALVLVEAGNWALVGWNLINTGTSNAYLKLFNSATTGAVTIGSTTAILTLCIPASGTALLSNEDKFQRAFNNGIVFCVTSGMSDGNSSAPGGACQIDLMYNANI